MWSLRLKENGEFYLTFDRTRYYSHNFRGIWEQIGPQNNVYTEHLIRVNQNAGLLCVKDDEGHVRTLVLE